METRWIVAAALLIASSSLVATAAPTRTSVCAKYERVAEGVMTLRQNGTRMSELMDAAAESPNEAVHRFMRTMIVEAYNEPHYRSPTVVDKVVRDFGNRIYKVCFKNIGKGE